jgi:hypothetical protein
MIIELTSDRNCNCCEATMKKGAKARRYEQAFVKGGRITHHVVAFDCMQCHEDAMEAQSRRDREEEIEGFIDSNFY